MVPELESYVSEQLKERSAVLKERRQTRGERKLVPAADGDHDDAVGGGNRARGRGRDGRGKKK